MPKAAQDFAVGNRMIRKGEDFEIPQGEEAEYRDGGFIEGEGPHAAPVAGNVDGSPLLGDAGATEDADETAKRGKRSAKE
jgi:hypothetical protein